jgi:hypothetical protein
MQIYPCILKDNNHIKQLIIKHMKTFKLFVLALCAAGLVACKDDPAPVPTTVELDQTELSLKIGETAKLNATVLPEGREAAVNFVSSAETVATVDQNGNVTAVAVGTATITATADDATATCEVTVSAIEVSEVQLDVTEKALIVGGTLQLTATVLPENATDKTVAWESSDEAVATVDENGLVTAVGTGEAAITATAGGMFAVCNITVTPKANVGDYFYSDGTYSSELDSTKKPVGIVFWTGDPTASDPTLKKDFPNCTNGLVIAIDEVKNVFWQTAYRTYNNTVDAWVKAKNLDFAPMVSGIEIGDPLNKIMGYNNTKAIEAFNAADENAQWPVTAMTTLDTYRQNVPVPATTSGWYLPSIKELNLAFSGEYPYSITDFDNESTEICDLINEKLAKVPGSIKYDDDYLSSTEKDAHNIYDMMVWAWYVPAEGVGKGAGMTFRAVLAF